MLFHVPDPGLAARAAAEIPGLALAPAPTAESVTVVVVGPLWDTVPTLGAVRRSGAALRVSKVAYTSAESAIAAMRDWPAALADIEML